MTKAVSVIIPVYGRLDQLDRCLNGLQTQSASPSVFEVILVNNAPWVPLSMDTRLLELRIIDESTAGSYAARNTGVRHARGEILAFLDSDCIAHPMWLERGMNTLQKNQILAGEVCMQYRQPLPTPPEAYDSFTSVTQHYFVTKEGFAATANLFVRKKDFLKVGYFREDLFSGGDMEWTYRAKSKGLKLEYSANTLVFHPARANVGDILKRARRAFGGRYRQKRHIRPSYVRARTKYVLQQVSINSRKYGLLWMLQVVFIAFLVRSTVLIEWLRLCLGGRELRS